MTRLMLVLVILVAPPLQAMAESKHTAAQLREALTGNTVSGVLGPRHYRQYFDPNGSTTYVEQSRPPTRGTWRVADDGRFCSVWGQAESCYDVVLNGNEITWGPGYSAAKIAPGNLL